MGVRHRFADTLNALKTRSGKVVMAGALLGGPIGMTGYVVAIANLGAAYTAIISAFYPAVGAFLAFLLLKEKMTKGQIVALFVGLFGVMAMGLLSAGDSQVVNAPFGLLGALLTVVGWGSEAVLCAWGMKDDSVDNETALQIRETTSALVYGLGFARHWGLGLYFAGHSKFGDWLHRARWLGGGCFISLLLQGYRGDRCLSCDGVEYFLFCLGGTVRPYSAGGGSNYFYYYLLHGNSCGYDPCSVRLE